MISLYRANSFLNTLSVNNYRLSKIVFFNENGIITKINCGYFDDNKEREFNGTCVRKLKEDFKYKDNFVIKDFDTSLEKRYILYVYEKNVDLKYLGKEKKYFGDIYSIWQVNDYKFNVYEKNLCENLYNLNNESKKVAEEILEFFDYIQNRGVDEKILTSKMTKLKKLNKKILQEVDYINNYEVTE